MNLFIGCSGYHFTDWKNRFYPARLRKKDWLSWYAKHFNTVEINNTFYKTPLEKTLRAWDDQTPDDFRFSIKGNRYITHMKKLKDVAGSVLDFYASIDPLAEKIQSVLWQLPPNLHCNVEKLNGFCRLLSDHFLNVVEFRHSSWFTDEVREVLTKHGVTMCSLSAPGDFPTQIENMNGIVYLRLHGANDWYRYNYSEKELVFWSDAIKKSGAQQASIYFNNDVNAYAPENATHLKKLYSGAMD